MANRAYNPAKVRLFNPGTLGASSGDSIDLIDDDIKVVLVDLDDYTFSAAHEFLSAVPVAARVATSANLTGKSVSTVGVFDADDVTFASVTGDSAEALVLYKDTGIEATSPLIAYIDTVNAGLPVVPDGRDIQVQWNATGIIGLVEC